MALRKVAIQSPNINLLIINSGYTSRLLHQGEFIYDDTNNEKNPNYTIKNENIEYARKFSTANVKPVFIKDKLWGSYKYKNTFFEIDKEWVEIHPEFKEIKLDGIVAFAPIDGEYISNKDAFKAYKILIEYDYCAFLDEIDTFTYKKFGEFTIMILDIDAESG